MIRNSKAGTPCAVVGCVALTLSVFAGPAGAVDSPPHEDIAVVYADIALAGYEDSLAQAEALQQAVAELIEAPSEAALSAAREAWIASRIPYMQTEVFRFGNTLVDDWEGKVNAWPLDEGLIDYVAGNPDAINVIANVTLRIGGAVVTAEPIDMNFLRHTLHEADGIETNVATGYHAVEFLLWGQDLHGVGPGAGERPATDFDLAQCTGGNCERRVAYLKAAMDLLVSDLAWMAEAWGEGGAAREALLEQDVQGVVWTIVTGLGSLAAGELAGARMQVGLELHDPEEEHDCFSDNTHESHYWDAVGLRNVYGASYQRTDGSTVAGASLSDLVRVADPRLDLQLREGIERSIGRINAIREAVANGKAYDQLLAPDDPDGEPLITAAIASLVALSEELTQVGPALGIGEFKFGFDVEG